MERLKCKLCPRDFANGKALGGHMRSHMLYHKNDAVTIENENGKRNSRDYSPDPIYRRESKRVRRSEEEESPLSSISDTATPDEDVARCLMMLSRDTWPKINEEEEEGDDDGEIISDIDEPGDSRPAKQSSRKKSVKGKYGCEKCGKVFRSYQALGGHMASHRRIKSAAAAEAAAAEEEKVYRCPFCVRVFPSGQALGGHKRSHVMGGTAIIRNGGGETAINQFRDIDLNLPAAAASDADDE